MSSRAVLAVIGVAGAHGGRAHRHRGGRRGEPSNAVIVTMAAPVWVRASSKVSKYKKNHMVVHLQELPVQEGQG